jgi:hypothetical protein
MAYIGNQPVPQATQTRDRFVATASQTSFATSGYTPGFLDVYLNGVKLDSTDYTATNGSDVVLASGATSGDIVEVVAFSAFESADHYSKTDSDTRYVNASGDTMTGDLIVNANVGIGTSSPTDSLHIYKAEGAVGDPHATLKLGGYSTTGVKISAYRADGNSNYQGITFNPHGLSSNFEAMRIDSSGRVTMPYQPAFYTKVEIPSGSPGDVRGKGTPITNTGSHFNGASGRFTAPIAGRYYFALDLSPGNNTIKTRYFYFYFQKNGSDISDYHLSMSETVDNNSYDNIGGSMILDLSAGDYVSARFAHHGSWNGDIAYGNFCGYLIG